MSEILEQVVEAPQRSAPVLDGSGELAVYQESTYSLTTHEQRAVTLVLNTQSGATSELAADGKNFVWIGSSKNVIWQCSRGGKVELWIGSARDPSMKYKVGSFSRDATLFQAVEIDNGDLGILLHASKTGGTSEAWPRSSGRVFTDLPCLTYDQGVGRLQYSLLYLQLVKSPQPALNGVGQFLLSETEPIDVLLGSRLSFFPYSGSMPNISTPNCSLSRSGVAFVAQDPTIDSRCRFTSEAYFAPLPKTARESFGAPVHLPTSGCDGWSALPVFSRNGQKLTFLRDVQDRSICMFRHIFVVDVTKYPLEPTHLKLIDEASNESPLYPEWLQWAPDGESLYFFAIDTGRTRLFSISSAEGQSSPKRVAPVAGRTGSVLSASINGSPSGPGRCLLVETSLTSPNRLHTLDLGDKTCKEVPNQNIPDFGLKSEQVSEVWIDNDGHKFHTFIMRPSDFDAKKKYPLALIIHGGPMASWLDAFHLYWTLPVFAEHGYVIVMPNYIGSTGYDRESREAVYGHFAERPYCDLEACMDYIGRELSYIDMDRAVSLGGSYGAYMNYWIAGQPLGKRFKALIAHAGGCFGNTSFYSSDLGDVFPRLLTSADEEFDSSNIRRNLFRSDSAQHAQNWSTPMLFTHGEKDNRCPLSTSVAAFTHCQHMGIESKLVVFPDESHFILQPENNYHWYREFLEFMDKYTKIEDK